MASSSSTSDSTSSESPNNNPHIREKGLLGRMAKLRENKEKLASLYKQKNELKQQQQDDKLDKKLMDELQANYYRICAQEYEFLKAMQSQRPCQLMSRSPSKRSDLALLNMCISILEIRQLQGSCIGTMNDSTSACAAQEWKRKVEYLKKLRDEKRRIIMVLRSVREKVTDEEEVDKTLVAEMLAKYDMLSFQEEELSRNVQDIESTRYQMSKNLDCENDTDNLTPDDRQKVA